MPVERSVTTLFLSEVRVEVQPSFLPVRSVTRIPTIEAAVPKMSVTTIPRRDDELQRSVTRIPPAESVLSVTRIPTALLALSVTRIPAFANVAVKVITIVRVIDAIVFFIFFFF